MDAIKQQIENRCETLQSRQLRDDLLELVVDHEKVVPLLTWIKTSTDYMQLTHLSVVDWLEDDQFQLTYILTNPYAKKTLMLCTLIDRKEATAETVSHLWPQAITYEQELNEMYGISFPGSPRQGVQFLLEGWNDIPPMRRDFDTLKYCEEHHPERPGREKRSPRLEIGKAFGEKGYLNGHSRN